MLSHCTPRAKGRPPISGMRLSLQNKVFLRVRQVCRIQCGGICFSVSVGRKTCDAEKIFLVLLIIDATILSHATNETAGRVVSYTGLRICGAPDEALNPAGLQQVLADVRLQNLVLKFGRRNRICCSRPFSSRFFYDFSLSLRLVLHDHSRSHTKDIPDGCWQAKLGAAVEISAGVAAGMFSRLSSPVLAACALAHRCHT
jgi:hypothetical protein